jgi:hypothetical protein
VQYGAKGQVVKADAKKKVGLFDMDQDETSIDHMKVVQNDSEMELFEEIRKDMEIKKKKKTNNAHFL